MLKGANTKYLYCILILIAAVSIITFGYHLARPKVKKKDSWVILFKKLGTMYLSEEGQRK